MSSEVPRDGLGDEVAFAVKETAGGRYGNNTNTGFPLCLKLFFSVLDLVFKPRTVCCYGFFSLQRRWRLPGPSSTSGSSER